MAQSSDSAFSSRGSSAALSASTPLALFPERQIRASFTESTVRVYQAYSRSIAAPASQCNHFASSPGFKLGRMTWIKPSFCWMAYRAGYSLKDAGQERILAIDLKRECFDRILESAVLAKNQGDASSSANRSHNETHCNEGNRPDNRNSMNPRNSSQVVVQWDPERDVLLNRLPYRSIQIGLRGDAASAYARGEYIARIADVTDVFREVQRLAVREGKVEDALRLLPAEEEYPVESRSVRSALHMDAPHTEDVAIRGAED
ncbi:hypothetical protein CLOP_g12438 [Closterium sp. NIES-67]|nr:hypothetical protein CLOP_g12438 [Closterium sp. NIES-67]